MPFSLRTIHALNGETKNVYINDNKKRPKENDGREYGPIQHGEDNESNSLHDSQSKPLLPKLGVGWSASSENVDNSTRHVEASVGENAGTLQRTDARGVNHRSTQTGTRVQLALTEEASENITMAVICFCFYWMVMTLLIIIRSIFSI